MALRSIILISVFLLTQVLSSTAQTQTAQKPCTPGISFWKLLEEVDVGYRDGRLSLGTLYAVCLPTPARHSASNYPYDPDGGGKLSTLVKAADGKVLNTYVCYATSIGGLWEMRRYKVVGGYEAVKPLAAGSHLLECAIDDQPFYRFPFTVAAMKSTDVYESTGKRYFIEGAWNEYGNIYYQRNEPQSALTFTTWVQDKVGAESKVSVPYDAKLV